MDIKYDRLDLYRAYALGREDVNKGQFHASQEVERHIIEENLDIPLSGEEEFLAKKEISEETQ